MVFSGTNAFLRQNKYKAKKIRLQEIRYYGPHFEFGRQGPKNRYTRNGGRISDKSVLY